MYVSMYVCMHVGMYVCMYDYLYVSFAIIWPDHQKIFLISGAGFSASIWGENLHCVQEIFFH